MLIEVMAVNDPLPIMSCSSLDQPLSSMVVMLLQRESPILTIVHFLLASFNLEQSESLEILNVCPD